MRKFNVIFYFLHDNTRLSFFVKNDKFDGVVSKAYALHESLFGNREVGVISVRCKTGIEDNEIQACCKKGSE